MATVDPEPLDLPPLPAIVHPPRIPITPPLISIPRLDLPAEDGIPMETPWHRSAMNLLIDQVHWQLRGRTDYYVGGNMFIYYGTDQARTWSYRGPDFFFVDEVEGARERRSWIVFEEAGRYPDVIIELTSPSTADEDHGPKKTIYERTFRTPDYFCYDPDQRLLEGWHLGKQRRYQKLKPNERGWLWCEALDLWLGLWEGRFQNQQTLWPRFYDREGNLILTEAEAERQRADVAEAEIARLKALLAKQGSTSPPLEGDAST